MNYLKFPVVLALISLVAFNSCKKDDEKDDNLQGNLSLSFTNLENLGSGYQYEGWIMVDGSPVTTGTFTVDDNSTLSQTSFTLDAEDLDAATAFILTIEPNPDNDPAPSETHLVAGDFSGTSASLTIGDSRALGNAFTAAAGQYIIATPTSADMMDENSGVWFVDPTGATMAPSLDLPELPAGWAYEGWAVINGSPLSTGTFTSVSGADAAAPYSGMEAGPPFPGEDFVTNAPAGLTFPTDLQGTTVVISIEPSPDNSAAPFTLKPLAGAVPASVVNGNLYSLDNNIGASTVTGTATR